MRAAARSKLHLTAEQKGLPAGYVSDCVLVFTRERGGLGNYVLVRLVGRVEEGAAHCKAPATWAAAAPATAAVLGSEMSLVAS